MRRHRHMVGAARQRRRLEPAVGGGVVDMVVGAVDPALAIAADDVHPAVERRRPGHLAARERAARRAPPSGRAGRRRRAVHHPLRFLLRGQVVRHAALEALEGIRGRRHGRSDWASAAAGAAAMVAASRRRRSIGEPPVG